jgi:hypothetical protein
MPAPSIITGPAIALFGGFVYYTEDDIILDLDRATWQRLTAMFGPIDEHLISQITTAKFKPVGALDTVSKYLPYALSQIGSLLFTGSNSLVLWSKSEGKKYSWTNAAILDAPEMTFSPLTSLFSGPMMFGMLGDPAKALTDAAAWNAMTTAVFADTSFDQTKLISARYTAALGSLASPFNAIESEDGFKFKVQYNVLPKKIANWGQVNALLGGIVADVRFKPVGIGTEDVFWSTLMQLQGATAILPGDSLSSALQDFVITGSSGGAGLTINKVGPNKGGTAYGLQPLRYGEVAMVAKKTWTDGVVDPLYALTFPS